jgi:hypothetical protein
MQFWGTRFSKLAPNPGDLLELFAKIHRHFVAYDLKTGLVSERFVSNDKKGYGRPEDMDFKYKKVGRQGTVGEMVDQDFRNTPYFFNQFHAECFQSAFPELWKRFVGGTSYWGVPQGPSRKPDPKAPAYNLAHVKRLEEEIKLIEGGAFPTLYASLHKIGMI